MMAQCEYKRFKRFKLCADDLTSLITLQTRELTPGRPGELASEEFTTIKQVWAAAKTVDGVARFSGVNIDDDATDLFYVRFDTDLKDLEEGNNFVNFDGDNFRILKVTNADRQKLFLIIQCSDRGDDTKEASEA